MKRLPFIVLFAVALKTLTLSHVAAEPASATQLEVAESSQDTAVKMRPTREYATAEWLLFPLQIPSFVLRAVTWPIGATIHTLRQAEMDDAFREETQHFYFQPYIALGAGGAFGLGVKFLKEHLFGTNYQLGWYAQYSTNLNNSAGFELLNPEITELWGRSFGYRVIGRYAHRGNQNYFGLGNGTVKSDEGQYSYYYFDTGVRFDYTAVAAIHIEPFLMYRPGYTGSKRGDKSNSVQNIFTTSELSGFNQWIHFLTAGIRLRWDTLDNQHVPHKGGQYSFRFERWEGLGNIFSFNEYFLDVRHYFPLWAERRVLSLRASMKVQQKLGDDVIPFNRLANLGLSAPLRGFQNGRFTDSAYILFNAEYRYPIWDYVDVVAFFDYGRVFDGLTNISVKDLKYSVGGGLWFVAEKFYFLRMEAGYGGEGVQFYVRATRSI